MTLTELTELLLAVRRHLIQSNNIISVITVDAACATDMAELCELSEEIKHFLTRLAPIIDELKD